ncbi:MAG: HugZ family protein [Magnetospiraceae bacterium]
MAGKAALPEDPVAAASWLLRVGRQAALGTLDVATGAPFVSLVTYATALDGAPLFLFSNLADHTKNLKADPRASLLVSAAGARRNPQTGPRVSLQGRMTALDRETGLDRFLARHPAANQYARFADFNLYGLRPDTVHFVGGFARAARFSGDRLICDVPSDFAADAASLIVQVNATDGLADALVHGQRGRKTSGWRAIALDPQGLDLCDGRVYERIALPPDPMGAVPAYADLRALAKFT